MLDKPSIITSADSLFGAREKRVPTPVITFSINDLTVDGAYSIQQELIKKMTAEGDVIVGGKIGLSSKANQEKFGINEPIFGHLLASMVIPEGDSISIDSMFRPIVEPEIAFLLSDDLKGPGVTVGNVLSATAGVMPAFEIADSRYETPISRIEDNIADNSGAAIVILGGKLTTTDNLDLRLVGMVLEENGEVISTGAGAAVLGNPAQAVANLANRWADFDIGLKAGDTVISGTPVAAVPAEPGDFFEAIFDRLGAVSVRFV